MDNSIKKEKVLFVITKSNWGGAQRYVYELATGLPRDKFEVVVVLGGEGLLVTKLLDAGVRTISLPDVGRDVSPIKDLGIFFMILNLFCKEHPDVVHLNSAKMSVLGAVAGRIARVPKIIFTAHGWAFNEDRHTISRIIIKLLYFATIFFSHKTIAVSQAVAKEAPAWGMRKKIIVIYPPVSHTQNVLEKGVARKQLTKKMTSLHDNERLWVGIVAELHKSKGILYAIEAMCDTCLQEKTILVILGEGQERKFLENLIQKNNLEKSVFLLGFQENAASFMPAFDIFLFPSTTEAFGYVVTEAGLAGLPVVASRVGGIPEITEGGVAGLLVHARDSGAIKDALVRLIDSPALRTSLGATLREKVLRDFSAGKAISSTIALYEKRLR